MITKDLIKSEIDKIPERYLDVLYRIIKALITPNRSFVYQSNIQDETWPNFIERTYGSLADDPLNRGDQGQFEIREPIE